MGRKVKKRGDKEGIKGKLGKLEGFSFWFTNVLEGGEL